ncbi:MAG TPA: CDP-alcohol phosphatidyltransferase family protein [Bosea sp. (in: a-proteobacteria)]|uniref:CDP-alcohol phosphatidyltransferase family protein n=1 Tax=Bosea sp. (in: a-proteobacteria) TaxID=1871050 RepID=UPI002E1074A5|nr:CDP-alcohol phosphatidyltransferase family protein [Bosea sp. (in: a-proteobacteria)]
MIRINNSLVGAVERKTLAWLVRRVPASIGPDHLTAFGIFGAAVTLLGYALTAFSPAFLWLASLGLVFHWFGDSLDGSLARFRKIERPKFGYFLDQTIDVIGNLLICIGMGLSAYVRMDVALLALAGYHALSIYALVKACVSGEFNVSLAGWGPTEMRLLIILMNTTIFFFGAPEFAVFGVALTWCDITIILMAIGFFTLFVSLLASYASELAREERPGRKEPDMGRGAAPQP